MKLTDIRERYKSRVERPEPVRLPRVPIVSKGLMVLEPLGKVRPILDSDGRGEVTLEVLANEYTNTIDLKQVFQVAGMGNIGVFEVTHTSHTFTNEGSTIQVTGRLMSEDF